MQHEFVCRNVPPWKVGLSLQAGTLHVQVYNI